MARFDWKGFEDELFDSTRAALADHARTHPREAVYAVGLHGLYAEQDGVISLPVLAVAVQEGSHPAEGEGLDDSRWNPADWSDPDIPYAAEAELSARVTEEATRRDLEHWHRTHERFVDALVAVVSRLRDAAPSIFTVTPDFAAAVFDEIPTPELVQRTVPPALFAQLFGAQLEHEAAVRALQTAPPDARAAFLVGRLGSFGPASEIDGERARDELVALGARAIEPLLAILDDPERRWQAAMLLGLIGIADPAVIAALRSRAAREPWCARALGMLGDDAWLAGEPAEVAVEGVLGSIDEEARRRLDYRPLERLLDARPELHDHVERRLAPGSAHRDVQTAEVDEALRALSSAHAVVRWHAAAALGNRAVGKPLATRIVPALAGLFEDADDRVRRLAILSFAAWRPSVRPYRAALERRRDDADAVVRQTVAKLLA